MSSEARSAKKPRTMADDAQWFANRDGKGGAKALTVKEQKAIGKKGATARWSRKHRGGA